MKLDYTYNENHINTLRSTIGNRLERILSLLETGDSAEEIILEFKDREIVIDAHEDDNDIPWMCDNRTVLIHERSCGAPDGNLLYPKAIGKTIKGISRIVVTMKHSRKDGSDPDIAEYERGLIIHFEDSDLVIDRGEESWSEIWRVDSKTKGETAFGESALDPEYPEYKFTTKVIPL